MPKTPTSTPVQHSRQMPRSHFSVDKDSDHSYSTPLGREHFHLGCSSLASIQVHDLLLSSILVEFDTRN